jgi:hypothetical protein
MVRRAAIGVGILLGVALLGAAGCGSVVTPGTGGAAGTGGAGGQGTAGASSSSAGSGGSGGSGGAPAIGDCVTDADCGGAPCVTLVPGGYRVCIVHVDPVTSCGPGQMGCCDSSLCAGSAHCFPPFGYCGGIVGPQNKCLEDQCQVGADCPAGHVCVPAGVLAYPVKTCMPAACTADADCAAHAGGRCEPVEDTCCAGVFGLFCVYPGGCRRNVDCPASAGHCYGDPATGVASCVSAGELPGCPI